MAILELIIGFFPVLVILVIIIAILGIRIVNQWEIGVRFRRLC